MNSVFKNEILLGITQHEASRPKRRPLSLDPSEALDCLFKLVGKRTEHFKSFWREWQIECFARTRYALIATVRHRKIEQN